MRPVTYWNAVWRGEGLVNTPKQGKAGKSPGEREFGSVRSGDVLVRRKIERGGEAAFEAQESDSAKGSISPT